MRLFSYLAGREADVQNGLVPQADVVQALRSSWPGDPRFPHALRRKLRSTENDMATPTDGSFSGIGHYLFGKIIVVSREWTVDHSRLRLLTDWLTRNRVGAILTDAPVAGDLRAAIVSAGTREITFAPVGANDTTPLQALAASIDRVIDGFSA